MGSAQWKSVGLGVAAGMGAAEAMSTYLNGFHMYADEMNRQVGASHFCIHLRHDLHRCVIFDHNAADARLIGIEYIISEERFRDPIVNAITAEEDAQLTEIQVRPRQELSW